MKSIHWKLSSKAEDLQVRDFNTNDDQHVYIFVDFAQPTPSPQVEKSRKQKHIRQLLKQRERRALLPSIRLNKISDKAAALDIAVSQSIQSVKKRILDRRQAAKRRRRLQAGNSTSSVKSMDEIDALIRATARKRVRVGKIDPQKEQKRNANAQKKEQEQALLRAQMEAEDAVVQKLLEEIDGDMREAGDEEIDEAVRVWGGAVLSDFADEMPEFCADTVAEIAVAEVMNEIRHGHHCTVAWFDPREDSGVSVVDAVDLSTDEEI